MSGLVGLEMENHEIRIRILEDGFATLKRQNYGIISLLGAILCTLIVLKV